MSRLTALALVLSGLFLAAGVSTPSALDEGEALRQIKSDVFDQKWDAVLAGCTQFISGFPRSRDLSRAYYYRAQGLEHIKGREEDAIAAYTDYVTRFPGETGALREDALLSRVSLATTLYLKGNKKYVSAILQGMDEKGYPGIYAAIQASKIDHLPARAKALPILKQGATSYGDAEVKNECVLGLLRIDPKVLAEIQGPQPPTPPKISDGHTTASPPSGEPAKLIRVEVFDKAKNQVSVRVNMPMAFAELLLDSLSAELRDEIDEALKQKGVALEKLLESFKKAGKQTIVEIDNDQQHIRVWIE